MDQAPGHQGPGPGHQGPGTREQGEGNRGTSSQVNNSPISQELLALPAPLLPIPQISNNSSAQNNVSALWSRNRREKQAERRGMTCLFCARTGHEVQDCWALKRRKQCDFCSSRGHPPWKCPINKDSNVKDIKNQGRDKEDKGFKESLDGKGKKADFVES